MKRMGINKATDWVIREIREIRTIEDLEQVATDYDGYDLVIRFDSIDDNLDGEILIYDDYIE